MFKKTIVSADTSIVFENKESLKRIAVTTDDLLIASVEGLLSKQETALLNQQIAVDAQMQHNYGLYKQTKLVADASIVYEDKEELKRKERRIIPFYYYVAAAASIAFLLFFYYNNGKTAEQNFANNDPVKTIPTENNSTNGVVKNNEVINSNVIAPVQTASVVKHKNNKLNSVRKDSVLVTPIIVNESPIIPIAENKEENKHKETPQILPIIKNEQPATNNSNAFASNQEKQILKPLHQNFFL